MHMINNRIVILTSSFPRWPNDTDPPFVYELARRISGAFDISVLAPHCNGARLREDLDGIKVVRFRYAARKHEKLAYEGGILSNLKNNFALYALVPLFLFSEFFNLLKLVIDLKPKVIHAHWVLPQALIAVIVCKMTNAPPKILCTAHGGDIYGLKGRVISILRQFVFRNIDCCTVVSNAMRKDIHQQVGDSLPVHVMPMGVDLKKRFLPPIRSPHKNQLIFVGRLVEKKGVQYLIKAVPAIRKAIPDATLVIIGDGHEKHRFEMLAQAIGVADCVSFRGSINNKDLPRYYQDAEILIFPSVIASDGDREGLGLVPVEAMGCGCGVIVTDLEALEDVVEHRINGLVVPQRSSEAITEAVVNLLQNRSLLRQFRHVGRQRAIKQFEWSVVANKYQKLIQSLIDTDN